jgi:dTDP-4-dehydrorhamnose reductase
MLLLVNLANQMQKVLLLGKNGQLGKALEKELSSSFEVHSFSQAELDITDFTAVEEVFEKIKPDFCINAAAYTNVDQAESERDLAQKINADAVGNLAELCKKLESKLIHFSTDYVFGGDAEAGYAEDATTNPINFYGQTKLEGEEKIQASGCDFAIVRTSWLFGDGKNFVNTMLGLAEKMPEIKVVSDQTGCPTFTEDLAAAVHKLLTSDQSGIFHLTNAGATAWADFARKIFEIKNLPTKVIDIPTEEYPTPAKRPKNSVLLNAKLPKLRSWEEALGEFLSR